MTKKDAGLVGPGAYAIWGTTFKKKEYKTMHTELGMSVTIYLE